MNRMAIMTVFFSHILLSAFGFDPNQFKRTRQLPSVTKRFEKAGSRLCSSSSAAGAYYNAFDKAGGILYRQSVFSRDEVAAINREVNSFSNQLRDESSSSVAQNRLGAVLPPASQTWDIFQRGSLHRLLEKVTGQCYALSPHLPLEIRSYEKMGACMAWHVDDVLYNPPQIEFVWTLENTSDCQTMWKTVNDKVELVETDVNSVILLQAGGPSHCVTSLKRGRRVILKSAYVLKDAVFQEGEHKNQFGSATLKRKTKGRKKNKR